MSILGVWMQGNHSLDTLCHPLPPCFLPSSGEKETKFSNVAKGSFSAEGKMLTCARYKSEQVKMLLYWLKGGNRQVLELVQNRSREVQIHTEYRNASGRHRRSASGSQELRGVCRSDPPRLEGPKSHPVEGWAFGIVRECLCGSHRPFCYLLV